VAVGREPGLNQLRITNPTVRFLKDRNVLMQVNVVSGSLCYL
jgi:hypothetical protein